MCHCNPNSVLILLWILLLPSSADLHIHRVYQQCKPCWPGHPSILSPLRSRTWKHGSVWTLMTITQDLPFSPERRHSLTSLTFFCPDFLFCGAWFRVSIAKDSRQLDCTSGTWALNHEADVFTDNWEQCVSHTCAIQGCFIRHSELSSPWLCHSINLIYFFGLW